MSNLANLRKMIFVGCRELRLDQEARRDLQLRIVGKSSLAQMTEADMQKVVAELKKSGFRPTGGNRHKLAPRGDLRLVHVLWQKLGDAGVLHKPGRDGLNAFVRSKFGQSWKAVPADIDMLRDAQKINAVIQALQDWCGREGIEVGR